MLSEDPMEATAFRFLSFGPFALREHLGSPACRVDGGGSRWKVWERKRPLAGSLECWPEGTGGPWAPRHRQRADAPRLCSVGLKQTT